MKHPTPSVFHFKDMTDAWHGMHDYMFNNEKTIRERGGNIYGSELVTLDNVIYIDKATIDPEFNFGKILGYKMKKWSKLINNYLNFNYLDPIKHEVIEREIKRGNSYNFVYRFDNSHGSGKDCLISLTFSKRKGDREPTLIFTSRASEWTKRVAFDFLLIQRIAEYVYGDRDVKLICWLPFIFMNLECSLMYVAEYGKKVIKKDSEGNYSPFQARLVKKFKLYQEIDTETIKYKVHQRAAMQVQRDKKTGRPIANCPDLFAKEMDLYSSNKYSRTDLPGAVSDGSRAGRPPKDDSVTGLQVYKEIKKTIIKAKDDKKKLQNAMVALGAKNDYFWPKEWDTIAFKRICRAGNERWHKKALKLITKYI